MWKPLSVIALVAAVGTASWIASDPGQATLLRGYIQHEQADPEPGNAQQNVAPIQAQIQADSFPASYSGLWRVDTEVSDSSVNDVAAGEKMLSSVEFKRQPDGRITAQWN